MIAAGFRTRLVTAMPAGAVCLLLTACGSSEHSAKGVIRQPVVALPADGSRDLLVSINQARKTARRAPLTVDPRLLLAAGDHSDSMARHGSFSHRGIDGSDFSKRMARHGYPVSHSAENIAKAPNADTVFQLWFGSRGHKTNMLNKNYNRVGIARSGDYWTAVFSAPDGT